MSEPDESAVTDEMARQLVSENEDEEILPYVDVPNGDAGQGQS